MHSHLQDIYSKNKRQIEKSMGAQVSDLFNFCHIRSGATAFEQGHNGPARKLSTNLYDTYHCWV